MRRTMLRRRKFGFLIAKMSLTIQDGRCRKLFETLLSYRLRAIAAVFQCSDITLTILLVISVFTFFLIVVLCKCEFYFCDFSAFAISMSSHKGYSVREDRYR
jgi:hypothetical protein